MRTPTTSNHRLFPLKALLACLLLTLIVGAARAIGAAGAVGAAGTLEKDERSHAAGRRAIRDGEYEKAVKVFLGLVAEDPGDVRARLGAALAYYKLQDYKLTFDQATEVLKLDDKNARAHALSGIALLRSGYIEHAVAELLQALQLNSKEALAWGGLAEIDYYTNRTRESRDKASYAIELDSKEPDYFVTFARAASRLELFTEAADAYERFLRVAPRTDTERRDRIRGLIQFYRQLAGVHLHQLGGPRSATVKFRIGADRRPYMDVRVNGRPATFVIDTGSGFTVISDEAAARLGVAPMARGGTSQGVGGNGKFPIVYGLINTVQLGEEKIESVPCFIRRFHGSSARSDDAKADGFIGLSVLSNFTSGIDYKSQQLSLVREGDEAAATVESDPSITVIPFRTTQNGLISVETQIDGSRSVNAIVDTGASSTVLSSVAVKRLEMVGSIIKGQTVQVVGAAGVTDNVELLFLRTCKIANLSQNNLRALILDFGAINETSGFEQSAILGGDFLRHFKVTIDFNHARLILEPQTPAVTRSQPDQKVASQN
jgi:predicted aspartyl protease/cytochrome c-type biogenesis protein CcmH/NrfG